MLQCSNYAHFAQNVQMFRSLLQAVDLARHRPAAIKNPDSAKHCRGFYYQFNSY